VKGGRGRARKKTNYGKSEKTEPPWEEGGGGPATLIEGCTGQMNRRQVSHGKEEKNPLGHGGSTQGKNEGGGKEKIFEIKGGGKGEEKGTYDWRGAS